MSNIYHYCSLETFAQIIKNKTLRLSDLDKTNDYMEKKWGIQFLYEALCSELQHNGIDMDLTEDYWYSDEAHTHLAQLENDIRLFLDHQTLIACLSTEKDMLSQWRAYANDGVGIAIGFDFDLLMNLLNKESPLLIGAVIYDKEAQEKAIREKLFNPAFSYMKAMFERDVVRCSDNYNEYFIEEFDCFCEIMDVDVEKVFSFLKNPAFEEEKEVRIVYNTGIYKDMEAEEFISSASNEISVGKGKKLILKPMQYIVKGDKLVAYTDLYFGNCIKHGIIKEIIIGPKASVSINDISNFLLINGFSSDVQISESRSSYR